MNKRKAKRYARVLAAQCIENAMSQGLIFFMDELTDADKDRLEAALDEIIKSLENMKADDDE